MSPSSYVRWKCKEDLPCLSNSYQRLGRGWEETTKEWNISLGDEAHDVEEKRKAATPALNYWGYKHTCGSGHFMAKGMAFLSMVPVR